MQCRKLRLATALTLVLAGSGCACDPVIQSPVPLPMPARPDLPAIPADSLMCLSDEAYTALVERDAKLKAYAQQLEAIIQSTHK